MKDIKKNVVEVSKFAINVAILSLLILLIKNYNFGGLYKCL